MLHRPFLCASGALLLAFSASAQKSLSQPIPPAGVKNAGVYHLATDTWTRSASNAFAWNDIVYDNSCQVGWYRLIQDNLRIVDTGRVPSTSSPVNPGPPYGVVSWTGTQDSYVINYFEYDFCTWTPAPLDLEVNFWECFSACANSTLYVPTATFLLSNMPGAGTGQTCWLVGIDLANSGQAFPMQADCDGSWNGGGNADTFGWSFQQVTPASGGTGGPVYKGDPAGYLNGGAGGSGCDVGAHTVFYGGSDVNNTQGTGLGSKDRWELDDMSPPPTMLGCHWSGGYDLPANNLWSSFHMVLGADSAFAPSVGIQYCPGDGIAPHTPCPFANNNNGSMGGCDWGNAAFLGGGVLAATGSDVWANNNTILQATAIENNFGIFFGANNQTNGGNGSPLNDGLRCAGGGLIRLTAPTMASGNTAILPAPVQTLDIGGGSGLTRRYQYWFRTPTGPGGTMANLTNGYEIAWL